MHHPSLPQEFESRPEARRGIAKPSRVGHPPTSSVALCDGYKIGGGFKESCQLRGCDRQNGSWQFLLLLRLRSTQHNLPHYRAGVKAASKGDQLHLHFAERVKKLMLAKHLSTNRLADFSGIGRGRMSEILSGRSSPTLRTLGRIAAALEVAPSALLP